MLKKPLNKSWHTCLALEIAEPYVTNLANSPRYYLRFVPCSARFHAPFTRTIAYSEVPLITRQNRLLKSSLPTHSLYLRTENRWYSTMLYL